MKDPLTVYLQDHAAGAQVAIDLLKTLQKEHEGEALGRFATRLLSEIHEDLEVLQQLIDRLGGGTGKAIKKTLTRVLAKSSRLKFGRDAHGGLGTFEALETLSLGILGKQALWQALTQIGPGDARLAGVDLAALLQRAEIQHARVEQLRLQLAQTIFSKKL